MPEAALTTPAVGVIVHGAGPGSPHRVSAVRAHEDGSFFLGLQRVSAGPALQGYTFLNRVWLDGRRWRAQIGVCEIGLTLEPAPGEDGSRPDRSPARVEPPRAPALARAVQASLFGED